MLRPIQVLRLIRINRILMQNSFLGSVLGERHGLFRTLRYLNPGYYKNRHRSRGVIVRETLESLGPIYIKFGQMLSTRGDLVPEDIILELRKLQDQVPPFNPQQSQDIIEKSLGQKIDNIFLNFEQTPLASASVAQVHAAELKSGEPVIIKVIRPTIYKTIQQDIAVLELVASLTERYWKHGKRLKPKAVVAEFAQTLTNELDLQHEAANAALLRRNFEHSDTMYVPKIYWDYVTPDVMVMERIFGIPLNDMARIKSSQLNLKTLSESGVEIFFTQVFRDGFFHADMHPGNMFIDDKDPENPRYLGVDFGIMGTLNEEDQRYLALNMLAFFNRDYKRVATLHVESGWVDPNTRIDQFEAAIRTVCEPIFERPLAEISFGKLLLRLFQTAERFKMEVQPQLLLLQKTLFNIESLGRQLYPTLNLWDTAKPFLNKWLKKQRGISSLAKLGAQEFHDNVEALIKMPQLMQKVLLKIDHTPPATADIKPFPKWRLLGGMIGVGLLTFAGLSGYLTQQWQLTQWLSVTSGCLLLTPYLFLR